MNADAAKAPKKPASRKAAEKAVVAKRLPPAKKAAAKRPGPAGARKAPATAGAPARIDRMIAELGDWRGERLAAIRKLIHALDPAVVEEWKWKGTPVWSHQGMFVLANAHRDKVKLTFFHGAQLQDPGGLFNAGLGGGKWRAIDIREGDRLDPAALKALLREAMAYNAAHRVPKSRGSRA